MISFISSSEIINVVKPDPNIFLWIAASVADAAAANPNGIKTLFANNLSTFPIKGNPVFSIGLKSLPKTSDDCHILHSWVLENFILADEPFAKALQIFENFVLLNNNLCGKLVSSLELPIRFDEGFKVTSVPFFIADLNLLTFELDHSFFSQFRKQFLLLLL